MTDTRELTSYHRRRGGEMTDDEINAAVHRIAAQVMEVTHNPEEMGCIIGGLMLHFTRSFQLPDRTGADLITALASGNAASVPTRQH